MSTNAKPVAEAAELDWRWVGEPESWLGLRSEGAVTYQANRAVSASEPGPGRFAVLLTRSLLSLFRS